MKILFSITYYHPYVSGLTIAASRWAEGLEVQGETVTVLAMQHEKHLKIHERIHGVSVERAPWIARISKGFISLDWLVKSWRMVRLHDVVVINLPQFEGIIPAIAAKLQGKRVVTIYHCELDLPRGFVNTVIQSLLEVSHFITLLFSDKVVTYTSDYAKHSRLLKGRKVIAIVPPIPKLLAKKTFVEQLKKRIGKTDVVIGVAARLSAEKGIEYLLDAMPYFAGTVVIAGSMEPVGEKAYKKKILTLVKKYKDRVIFLGEIKPEDMGSFYSLLDILVLPSINSTEAFGMVQVEAMLAGVPVVVSDLPGVRIPVKKTGMGLVVPPKDPKKLAEAIAHIQTNRRLYTKENLMVTKEFSEISSIYRLSALMMKRNANSRVTG